MAVTAYDRITATTRVIVEGEYTCVAVTAYDRITATTRVIVEGEYMCGGNGLRQNNSYHKSYSRR